MVSLALKFIIGSEVIFKDPPKLPFKTSIKQPREVIFVFEVDFLPHEFTSKKITSMILRAGVRVSNAAILRVCISDWLAFAV